MEHYVKVEILAYSYQKLGDQATSQQYIEILKLNYPHLVKSNGEVNLRAARKEGSWVNRATLGLLGRESKTVQAKDHVATEVEQPSLTNRLSFGLLDKPEVEEVDSSPSTAPVISNTEQPSWMNRLSFGLLDKSETPNTSEVKATN